MTSSGGAILDRGARVRRCGDLLSADVDGEMVMMDVETGVYFGLDAIGTDIWKRLEAPVTVADLTADLVGDYDAAPETIERDVLALLTDMKTRGLVEVC